MLQVMIVLVVSFVYAYYNQGVCQRYTDIQCDSVTWQCVQYSVFQD